MAASKPLGMAILSVLLALAMPLSALAQTQGHPASQLRAGTFGAGNYVFPDNLTVGADGDLFVDDSTGYVGIGTTSPGIQLDIQGGGDLILNDTGGSDPYIGFYNGTDAGGYVYFDESENNMVFRHADDTGSNDLVVSSSGYVGIGTTDPGRNLHVVGITRIESTDSPRVEFGETTEELYGSIGVNGGIFRIDNRTSTYSYDETFFAIDMNTGSVGIGTTSPELKLHVNQTFVVEDSDNANRFLSIEVTDDTPYITWDNNDELVFGTKGTEVVAGVTNEYMRIDNTGNVGIGTASPGEKLHVNGSTGTQLRVSHNAQVGDIELETTTTGGLILVRDSGSTADIVLDARSGQDSYFNTGGDVGIGTASPSKKLHVNTSDSGANPHLVQLQNTAPGGSSVYFGIGATGAAIGEGNFYISDSLAYRMIINTSNGNIGMGESISDSDFTGATMVLKDGNVGIGTDSPGATLHVDGDFIADTDSGNQPFYITRIGGTTQALEVYVTDDKVIISSLQDETVEASDYGSMWFYIDDDGLSEPEFRFYTKSGTNLMTINGTSGNVGIGTTDPGTAKLNVSGDIYASGAISGTSCCADYVFGDDYPLMSLDELESFVGAEEHLPGLPSADEQGSTIDFGERMTLLLEKIEELTLYAIEQDNEIEDLAAENAALRQALCELNPEAGICQ